MHGNVCEWCQDWYADYPSGVTTDPHGPKGGSHRVSRGGCWFMDASSCASASRSCHVPSLGFDYIGFRGPEFVYQAAGGGEE